MDFIHKGIEAIKLAARADASGDIEVAFGHYKAGIAYLLTACKYEKSAPRKSTIQTRLRDYLMRAEQLKEQLDARPSSETAPPSSQAKTEKQQHQRRALLEASALRVGHGMTPVHWNDIAGLAAAKQILREAVVLPMRLPHLFGSGKGQRKPWSAILLYGPPGTGKTQLARAVATESKAAFFTVSAADLMSKWVGESEKAVRDLFALAAEHQPAVVFIDEIDSLCGQRGEQENEAARRVKNEFLVQTSDLRGVLLLAATNLPWQLDTAFRRRFKKRVYIPLPDQEARVAMFRIYLQDKEHVVTADDMRTLAVKTDGYSGSDVATLIEEAHMIPVRFLPDATHFCLNAHGRWIPCSSGAPGAQEKQWDEIEPVEHLALPPMTMADLEEALARTPRTVSQNDLRVYDEWTADFGMSGDN